MSMAAERRGPGRGFLAIIVAALGLALLAIVLVALRGDRVAAYPPGSPEAAYQGYIAAYEAGDIDASYAFFSAAVRTGWTKAQYRSEKGNWGSSENARILIDSSAVSADRATLRITLERSYADGLTSSRSREGFDLRLVREDGEWRIDQQVFGLGQPYR